ncbi:hypothetical protein R6Z07F_014349 [Ovis aries]
MEGGGVRVLRGWLPRESAAPGLLEGARDGVQPGPPVFAVGLAAWRSAGSEDGGRGEGGECVRRVCKGVEILLPFLLRWQLENKAAGISLEVCDPSGPPQPLYKQHGGTPLSESLSTCTQVIYPTPASIRNHWTRDGPTRWKGVQKYGPEEDLKQASGGMEKTKMFHKPSGEEEEITERLAGEPPKKAATVTRRLSNPNKPVSRQSPPGSQQYQCKPDPKSSQVSGEDRRVLGKQRELRTSYTRYRPEQSPNTQE